ncbi:MAG TPA: hypothetical protein VFC07_07540, partial [Verrucomicrobiae bacterium]|nr:hypothetical protein [Verrucomicrobiae bacterium]
MAIFLAVWSDALAAANSQPGISCSITDVGPNSRTWEWTNYQTSSTGQIPEKHSYVELATGMHYLKDGKWVESKEQIHLLPDGSAAATEGQYQVYFPPNLYSGAIELVTPDGLHLK